MIDDPDHPIPFVASIHSGIAKIDVFHWEPVERVYHGSRFRTTLNVIEISLQPTDLEV